MLTREKLIKDWEFTGLDVIDIVKQCYEYCQCYGHKLSYYGIAVWLDDFIIAKKDKIEAMMSSKYYNGNLALVMPVTMIQPFNKKGMEHKYNELRRVPQVEDIVKTVNEEGKTAAEVREAEHLALPDTVNVRKLSEIKLGCIDFDRHGNYIPSVTRWNTFLKLIDEMRYFEENINENQSRKMAEYGYKFGVGMKTARAVNRIFNDYGYDDNHRTYQRAYALYSNAARQIETDVMFAISLHPIAILTASFGRSWSSCMTIDFQNLRNVDADHNWQGAHMGGLLSYSKDDVTEIAYTYHASEEVIAYGNREYSTLKNPEYAYKINRQWIHFNEDMFVQGRMYPQINDGDMGDILRSQFAKHEAELLGFDFTTWTNMGNAADEDNENFITTQGSHYADYGTYDFNTMLYIYDYNSRNSYNITIGNTGTDLMSGKQKNMHDRLSVNDICSMPREYIQLGEQEMFTTLL